jgi:hypothetical protein
MPEIDTAIRCHYRDSAGRRCRLPRKQSHPTFCARHARPAVSDPNAHSPDVSAELLGPLCDFRTATSINYTLGRLLIYKAAGEISARDTAVIAYICQLLLQSVPSVRKELNWSHHGHAPEDEALRNVLQATSSLWDEADQPGEKK